MASLTSSKEEVMSVQDLLQQEIDLLKMQYQDVLENQQDLRESYETKIPAFLDKMIVRQNTAEAHQFRKQYISMKKNLELQILNDNKKHEVISGILDVIRPGKNRESERQKYKNIQK